MNIIDNPDLKALVNFGSGVRVKYKPSVYIGEKQSYIIGDLLDANATQETTVVSMSKKGLLTTAGEQVAEYREDLDELEKVSDVISKEFGDSVSEKLDAIEAALGLLKQQADVVNPGILEYAQSIADDASDMVDGMEECCTNMNNTLAEIKTKITNDNKAIMDTLSDLYDKINEYLDNQSNENNQ